MGEAIDQFEILVRHGALCSRLEIDSLLQAYRHMEPSLHRHCNTPDVVDVDALLYAADRLPNTIYQVKEILIQADVPDSLPRMAGVVQLHSKARRRQTFQVGNDVIIVVAREGRTELLDLITLLCSFQLEAGKISRLLRDSSVLPDLEAFLAETNPHLEEQNRLMARLAFELGTTDDHLVQLDEDWDGELLERLHYLAKQPPRFVARLHRDYSVEASQTRARRWAHALKKGVDELEFGDGPVHIISSNTHSTLNLLSGYALAVEDEIWSWALAHSEHRERLRLKKLRDPNITYFLLRDWLKAFPQRKVEKAAWEKRLGIFQLDDAYHTGVRSQVFELAKIEPEQADPRVREYLTRVREHHPVLVNFDYAFGEQAGILVEKLFEQFRHRVVSFSIMGKAGTVVGGRGGIMLPSYLLKAGSRDVYDLPMGNALTPNDLAEFDLCEIHSGGPMLTVAGTILQNEDMLKRYRDEWKILGLEMEGIPYLRALHQCLKRGWVCREFDVMVGYYASDAPLEVGETLARELAFEGLAPTYGLNLAILRRILDQDVVGQQTREDHETVVAEKSLT